MNYLSEAEEAVFCFWREYIRSNSRYSIRPTLLYYLMTEELISFYQHLPDPKRPKRPSETALNDIGTTSGALSKWRSKWYKVWFSLQ